MSGHDHGHHHGENESGEHTKRADLRAGAGRGRVLFVDAFSGIAGDMFLAALIDLGIPEDVVVPPLRALDLGAFKIQLSKRERSGIVACKVDVLVEGSQPSRNWRTIRALLENPALPSGARNRATQAFERLARAESQVHGMPADDVHFHEVGAVDAIVDIVGVALALEHLDARIMSSSLPMGRGFVNAAHGPLPLPAPATLLCLEGVPTVAANVSAELVTPTGACLVASQAGSFGPWPSMTIERVGYGAGTRELKDRPNLLRLVLGVPNDEDRADVEMTLLEANIDDMSAELVAWALERTQAAGAVDTWATPIVMKKGRPGTTISALVPQPKFEAVVSVILSETTTLGIRHRPVGRTVRPRRLLTVDTSFGPITIKVGDRDGRPPNVAPEFESCRQAAEAHGVPLKQIYGAAIAAVHAKELGPLSDDSALKDRKVEP